MKLTAIIEESNDGWFVGQLEELPAVLSQGKTIEELKSNLIDALKLFLTSNREDTKLAHRGKKVRREQISVQ